MLVVFLATVETQIEHEVGGVPSGGEHTSPSAVFVDRAFVLSLVLLLVFVDAFEHDHWHLYEECAWLTLHDVAQLTIPGSTLHEQPMYVGSVCRTLHERLHVNR